MVAGRYLMFKCMEGRWDAEGLTISRQNELLMTVLASRAVLESDLEEIYAGPLGSLVLTQIERGRPKPLREVGQNLLRKHRDLARLTEDLAARYYHVQQQTIQ